MAVYCLFGWRYLTESTRFFNVIEPGFRINREGLIEFCEDLPIRPAGKALRRVL